MVLIMPETCGVAASADPAISMPDDSERNRDRNVHARFRDTTSIQRCRSMNVLSGLATGRAWGGPGGAVRCGGRSG